MTVLTNTRDAHAMDLKADETFYSPKSGIVERRKNHVAQKAIVKAWAPTCYKEQCLRTKWAECMRKRDGFPDV
jgi:hypothetical protein